MKPLIKPLGDAALTVEFENIIREDVNRRVMELDKKLKQENIPEIQETIPSYRALLVYYDPLKSTFAKLRRKIKELDRKKTEAEDFCGKTVDIPVCYGGSFGEDLAYVAAYCGLSREDVIRIHSAGKYRIYMLGFLPGFPYLGGMDPKLVTPRLKTPRTKIPAGSVGIGGAQTGIYPSASPGGWQLIGRTPVRTYDPERDPQILYEPGDYIRFYPISEKEFYDMEEPLS